VWDGSAGTPTVADMQGYDVVFVGNDILWTSSAIDNLVLSDRLADYIDAGGKVLAASFIWSYDAWGMAGGRFLAQDYSPFEIATTDYWDPISLGAFDAGHPIMAGITNVTENYNHQDPAISSSGVWVASWADGENFVGVAPNSVGLNALYFNNANFGGQAGELLHNALLYLAAPEEIPWLSEDPISGTVPPGECTVVDVTFDSTGMAPGDYLGSLIIASDDPDTPEVAIPVTLTVLEPAIIAGVTYTITGVEVAFDATVTGAAPLTYAWAFGDGGTANVEDPTHIYAATGCYTVTLVVSNGCGSDTWTGQVCVCEAVAGADFTWMPTIPWVGESVDFSGSIDAGSPPYVWNWDFGDGSTGSGQYTLHTYTAPGDYVVTLTVTNGCGRTVIEHPVTVQYHHYHYYLPLANFYQGLRR
jgi:PKD repeat protein